MSISSIPSSSDIGSSSQQTSLPTIPSVSFTSIGNISELLRDLVFVRPIDKTLLEFDVDENEPEIDSTLGLEKLNLFDNKSNYDRSIQLLNSNEPNLVDSLTKLLIQTDTSKLTLKPEYEKSNEQSFHYSSLVQSLVSNEPNLFNGELKSKLREHHQIPNSPKVEVINSPNNRSDLKQEPIAFKNDPIQPPPPQPIQINNMPTRSESPSYKIVSDPNRLCVKLTRIDSPKKKEELKDTIKPSSFYSNSTKNNQINSPKLPKKSERLDTKANLGLPDDFTPELIQQLAAEGYDLMGSGGRKSRNFKNQTDSSVVSTSAKKLLDSSSDDSDTNNDDNYKFKSKRDSKVSNTPSKNQVGVRLNVIKKKVDLSDPLEHPSYKRFSQILDDLLDSYEQDLQQMNLNKNKESQEKQEMSDKEQDDEIPSEYLFSRQVCADLVQEAFKLHTYSIMNLIKKENLFKLQNLLFYNIKDGIRSLHLMNEDSSEEKLLRDILVDKLLRACDCCIISLIIMTSPKIAKELIIEDIIEQITLFLKFNLNENIFPHYDPVYNRPTTSTEPKANSTKRKLFQNQSTNPTNRSMSSKHVNHVYNRMREILNFTSDLINQIDLTDTIIITLSSSSVMCFFVENINDLQLETLKILTNIFTRYEKHRQLVLDDILSSLIKLHSSKRNSRSYKCFSGDSIQMFTALILQLIQSEVTLLENETNSGQHNAQADGKQFEEKETFLLNTYEQANETAKKFLSIFFSKCKVKHADFDFRPLFENFIQDLLTTVNKPEWPVSEIILNLLGMILVNQIQSEQSDVQSRVNSLEYLGQIVSQLRKDSLEYQKCPDKIRKVLDKFKIESSSEDTIVQLQIGLINYVNTLVQNDQLHAYAKNFLISQWLKELNQTSVNKLEEHGEQRVDSHDQLRNQRIKIFDLIQRKEFQNLPSLDASEAFILSKYLSSLKKTLDKNFDFYLVNILNLAGSDTNTPTQVRSKAIKCLSLIIEADPQILLKQKVFACVESNFLHQTISVREASVDLIGRFITLMPELTNRYFKLLSERILDVGVSVRKRVIKIFRDICINQPDFKYLNEICVKILRRINDEDNIKKLVIDTFYLVWFGPCDSRELWLKRVMNLVDVVSDFNVITNSSGLEFFESLFSSLIVSNQSTTTSAIKDENEAVKNQESLNEKEILLNRSREVEKSCKKIVDCLIENVLRTEANTQINTTTTTEHAYKRLVSSFSTLYLLSKIKPDFFINHAETLLPYLNIKSTNSNDTQIINSAAKILECVVPLLQSPSNSFLLSLEESLCKLIFQSGMVIVSSCVSCLGTVVNKLTKNYKLAGDCLFKFYSNAVRSRQKFKPNQPVEQGSKPMLFRVLFTLGLLSKHFDVESDEFREFKICTKNDLFETFLYFIRGFDFDVQLKALIGLGSFLTRNSDYMMRDQVKTLYLNYIKSDETQIPFSLKSQVFTNLTDYLNEEDQRILAKSVELTRTHVKDDLKEMLDVQSGMASTIIQSFLKPILESYLTHNTPVRLSIFNCLDMILNQGLVYPIECVPYLIAMTTDTEKKIQNKSLTHLTNLQKAHPNFVQSKSIAGINVSYLLQKVIKNETSSDQVIRGYSESTEILSLNHHLYTLLRSNRSYRRAFMQQLLKMFDDSTHSSQRNTHTSLDHMIFISDNLAYFPYQLLDEPLYLIHHIDLIISCTGINLLQTFKEGLKNSKSDKSKLANRDATKCIQENAMMDSIDAFSQLECPQEADDDSDKKINKNDYDDDDDEEENYEKVYRNLPDDLKHLKECMYKAQGCCLLLVLKMFLKEVYTISDSKIQSYSTTDTAKVNDRPLTSRKTNRKFNPKQTIEYIQRYKNLANIDQEKLKESLVNEYLEFKELMLSIDQEDSNRTDENSKPNSKLNQNEAKISALQQKLYEGVEKTCRSVTNTPGGTDSVHGTPMKSKAKYKRQLSSSTKKLSAKKRKKKKDSDCKSSDDDFEIENSDCDDEY